MSGRWRVLLVLAAVFVMYGVQCAAADMTATAADHEAMLALPAASAGLVADSLELLDEPGDAESPAGRGRRGCGTATQPATGRPPRWRPAP
jgi:hypothetical protein